MVHQVLARKWRPRNFHEVVGQKHVVTALTNGLDHNRLHHAFLFTGTRGVGKTTLARILAKSLNCETGVSSEPCGICGICKEVDEGRFVDLIEIDAASRTKVEDTREILDNVQYAPTRGRYKVYLIDEVHMLSNSSFNALLKTLEEPPEHVKFLLATTDPQKLPVTVLSRCLRFHLKKLSVDEIAKQLSKILSAESIPFDLDALELLARAGTGSMRDALSLLDQAIAYTASNISFAAIQEMLGIIDDQYTLMLLSALASGAPPELLATTRKLSEIGLDYTALLESLIEAFHQLTLLQIDPRFISFEQTNLEEWSALAEAISSEDLQLYYQIALHGRKDLYLHPNIELGFEMTMLRMLLFTPDSSQNAPQNTKISAPPVKKNIPSPIDRPKTDPTPIIKQNTPESTDQAASVSSILSDLTTHKVEATIKERNVLSSAPQIAISNTADNPIEIDENIPNNHSTTKGAETIDQSVVKSASNPFAAIIDDVADDEMPPWIREAEASSTIDEHYESINSTLNQIEETSDHDRNEMPLLLSNNEEWLTLVGRFSLEGITQAIARNLVFKSFTNGLLTLIRSEEEKSFHVNDAEKNIAQAVSSLLKQSIACIIELVDKPINEENFDQRTDKLYLEQLAITKEKLYQEPVVRTLIDRCDAKLLEETIIIT